MKKSKLIVMFITFAVMLAVTPLIFGKLMNSKFNKMLDDMRAKGMVVKVVEDKSNYIQTDKVLEVEVPAKLMGTNGLINRVKLRVETKFKNLPVTNVVFEGNVENLELPSQYKDIEDTVNAFVKSKIHFNVTTPNFRDYEYTINDIKVNDENGEYAVEGIKGTFTTGEIAKSISNIKDIYFKSPPILIEFKNIKSKYEGNEKHSVSSASLNVHINIGNDNIQIDNVKIVTTADLGKTASINSKLGFDTLNAANIFNADKFNLELNINGIDAKLLEKIANAADPDEQDMYVQQMLEKGFNLAMNLNLKDIKVLGQDMGGINGNIELQFLPTTNIREKIREHDYNNINIKLHLVTTPQIASFIVKAIPESEGLFQQFAENKNGKLILNLEFKNGQLYSNGQLVQ